MFAGKYIMGRWRGLVLLAAMQAAAAHAVVVHVSVATETGGESAVVSEVEFETGDVYETGDAPRVDGFVFTHWTVLVDGSVTVRDELGHALDGISAKIYEDTVFVAHYVPEGQDSDGDGLADGTELYWYGDLAQSPASDTDADGATLAEELEAGTNPLIAETLQFGGIIRGTGEVVTYNPSAYAHYVIRTEPADELFPAAEEVIGIGGKVTTDMFDPADSTFAYWTVDGVVQRDELGRALSQIAFAMGSNDVEIVAVCVADPTERAKIHWYGTTDIGMDSDTDGDGATFAEELEAGTNPLIAESTEGGGIIRSSSKVAVYNPSGVSPYVIRSEPEGVLFETIVEYVDPGTEVETPVLDPAASAFAYWTVNGAVQRDELGRALGEVAFKVPAEGIELVAHAESNEFARAALHWYGTADVDPSCDTDGDGVSFRDEIEAGTNPLLAESTLAGGILSSVSRTVEVNLQYHEKVVNLVVDGRTVDLTDASLFGGKAVQPVIADVSGDGLWDIVLVYDGGVQVLVNVGSKGNPEFRTNDELEMRNDEWWTSTLAMNSTEKLATMTLDVEPIGALSATVWGEALLVSDEEGRIWFYTAQASQTPQASQAFALQHKVWGGSYAGFANGLRIAAVDWEDDGDLDCLCGTAEGRLILLRDPKAGRPTNLAALAGPDNVVLSWAPVAQSRVRGYRVYRREGRTDEVGETSEVDWLMLAPESTASPDRLSTALPNYRDYPSGGEYDYRVTSVSRYYSPGNSSPTVSESQPTDPVRVKLGTIRFHVRDQVCTPWGEVAVALAIENSCNVAAAAAGLLVGYDAKQLAFKGVKPTALTEGVDYMWKDLGNGQVRISANDGTIQPGSGEFFILVFEPMVELFGTTDAAVSLLDVSMKSLKGEALTVVGLPASGTASIVGDSVPAYIPGDLDGNGWVNSADLRELIKFATGGRTHPDDGQLKSGDLNGNGKLDNGDVEMLRTRLKDEGTLR